MNELTEILKNHEEQKHGRTVRDAIIQDLTSFGLSNSQAEKIFEIAKPQIESMAPGYSIEWDSPEADYPSTFIPILLGIIHPIALKWIDENVPNEWFRNAFDINFGWDS